jgi:hypothetical protein
LLKKQFAEVQRHAEEAGRDPKTVGLSVRSRLPLNDADRAIEPLRACQEIGVTHVVVETFAADMDRARALMDTLAELRPKALA